MKTQTIKDLPDKKSLILIHGCSGVGKTEMALTSGRPTLVIQGEEGIHKSAIKNVKTHYNKDITNLIHIFPRSQLDELLYGYSWDEEIKKFVEEHKIEVIVLDTLDMFVNHLVHSHKLIPEYGGNNNLLRHGRGGLTLAGWGEVGRIVFGFFTVLKNLNVDVVILSHSEREEVAGFKNKRWMIQSAGSSKDKIKHELDAVGYYDKWLMENDKKEEVIVHGIKFGSKYFGEADIKDRHGVFVGEKEMVSPDLEKILNILNER